MEGNDWHATSHLRNKGQKQSRSVNSTAVCLCAPSGSCSLPYRRTIDSIAPVKSTLPIVLGKSGILLLVQWDSWSKDKERGKVLTWTYMEEETTIGEYLNPVYFMS